MKTRWAVAILAALGLAGCNSGIEADPDIPTNDVADGAADADGTFDEGSDLVADDGGTDGEGFGEHWLARYAAGSTPVIGAATLGDGNIVVAGRANPGYVEGIWLMVLDPQGRVLRRHVADGFDSRWWKGGALIPLADGGALLASHKAGGDTGYLDIWLARIDPTGEILWQRTYGDALEEKRPALAEMPDGSLVLVAESNSFNGISATYGDIWVATLDADGEILRQFGLGRDSEDSNPAVVIGRDGRRYISINSMREDYESGVDVWLLALEADDTIAWQKRLGPGMNDGRVQDVDDEGFLLTGNTTNGTGFDYPAWIARISYAGEPLWQRIVYDGISTWARNARATPGGYLVTGGVQVDEGLDEYVLVGWVMPVGLDGALGTPTMIRDSLEGFIGETAFLFGDDMIFVATDGLQSTDTEAEVLVARMGVAGDRPADCSHVSSGDLVEGVPETVFSDIAEETYFTNGVSAAAHVVFRDELPSVELLCSD